MTLYEYLPMSYATDLSRINIPKYQRGLVWTKEKKNSLIETLHKGFPFGVILVAENHDAEHSLQLLDGQQRLATIRDYEEHKVHYWTELNVEETQQLLQDINQQIPNEEDLLTDASLKILLDPSYELADWTDELSDSVTREQRKALRQQIATTRSKIDAYINLNTLTVPVIKFQGAATDLPEVFENLNKGGTPLSKYEVFNAAWVNDLLVLPAGSSAADEILKNVKDYYLHMNENGKFEVSDFSEDELSETRSINMAEFARALGRFVLNRIPALMNDTDKNANEIGFGLLGIISGVDNKRIGELNTKLDEIQTGLEDTLAKVDRISKQLQNTFDKLSKQFIANAGRKNAKKYEYATALTSTFKLLSYFASLWTLNETDTQTTLKRLPAYYVYDYVAGLWNAHGDQRLHDYYPNIRNKNYLKPIAKGHFETAFMRWCDENTGIRRTFSRDLQALITIHANLTYLSNKFPHAEDYEFEHIIPKKRVLASDNGPAKVQLSSLGNGMLLPKSDNNRKKDKTLYETTDIESYQPLIDASDYPTEDNFNKIFNALDSQDYESVNNQINQRANAVINTIIDGVSAL